MRPSLSELLTQRGAAGDSLADELLDQVFRPEFFGATSGAVWCVMRQDDNGNRFEVVADLSREDAQARLDHLEASAHKQFYWVTPKMPSGLS